MLSFLGDVRRRFHRYRFEELPPETQEAILHVREFERSRAGAPDSEIPGTHVDGEGQARTGP